MTHDSAPVLPRRMEGPSGAPAPSAMNPTRMLLSLVAWIAFTVVLRLAGPDRVGWAAAIALAIAVVFLLLNLRSGLKILDVTSVATFAALTVTGFAGGPVVRDVLADYGRGGCALVLGLVMAISAATVPFTEQYARESVPRRYWGSPVFRAVNRRLSAVWAVIVLVMAAGHVLDGYLDGVTEGAARLVVDLLLNWVVPVGAVVLGIRITKRAASAHRPGSRDEPPAAS